MTRHTELDENKALFSLWKGWALSFGAITAIAVGSLWLNRVWLPIFAFTLALLLYMLVRRNRSASLPVCYAIPFLAIFTLVTTGVVMTSLDIWHTPRFFPDSPEAHVPDNPDIPYIGTLVVYPIAFIFAMWGWICRFRLPICIDCRIRFGSVAERGFIGMIFSQENMFQRRLLTVLTLLVGGVTWFYYFHRYINSDINRPDIYAYIVVPAAIYAISIIYMGIRYLSLWYYYNRDIEGTDLRHGTSTTLRYIIISGNEIYLHIPDSKKEIVIGDEKIDTPAKIVIPFIKRVDLNDARYYFLNMFDQIGNDDIEVRFMYSSTNATDNRNVFHYLVFVDSPDVLKNSHINGEWFTILNIKEMLETGLCSKMLGAEITRLHTIAMAWKTYDRDGHRLYRIKHYVPTFRVCDIRKWNVDYNDSHWLYVAHNNEDKPFYRFRKFWHRYVSGIKD